MPSSRSSKALKHDEPGGGRTQLVVGQSGEVPPEQGRDSVTFRFRQRNDISVANSGFKVL